MTKTPRLYKPEEVNNLIPKLEEVISDLRKLRSQIIQERDAYDIEELTSHGLTGDAAKEAKKKMDDYLRSVVEHEKEFETHLKFLDELECELKSLEPGLIDFYSLLDGNIIFLCWREGEEEVRYWHSLAEGFSGRKPIYE